MNDQLCLGDCQTEKDKCCVTSLICGIQKLKQTSDCNKKETNSHIQTNDGGVVTAAGDKEIQTIVMWKTPRRGKIPKRR